MYLIENLNTEASDLYNGFKEHCGDGIINLTLIKFLCSFSNQ